MTVLLPNDWMDVPQRVTPAQSMMLQRLSLALSMSYGLRSGLTDICRDILS